MSGAFWTAPDGVAIAYDDQPGAADALPVVCLPGLTRLLGNQEATTPGYVAGKKVCYQDGREGPEP
ncbi:MAG: hypothetical protein CVT86_03960 [Alphaproteobacteria bacterium HGW-Alphaproteobacteria-8]|nr:MAG: hypothetical protein CVT86_03960 [Alphaproteobacteria bacterium HGW-Alphaproteobacteria-8]